MHFNLARSTYDGQDAINQSVLVDFIYAATPAHFIFDQLTKKPDEDYIRIGNAIDCLVSSPSEFDDLFATAPEAYPSEPKKKGDPPVDKPWTLQSNWCKAWWQATLDAGKTPLTIDETKRVRGMIAGLERHEDIPPRIQDAHRQVCLIAVHPTLGFRMKALIDILPDVTSEVIYDLKSIGRPATPSQWSDQIAKCAYHLQASFYLAMARYCGIPATKFGWFVVESSPPHEAAIYYYDESDEEIQTARTRYTEAIPRYMQCKESGIWPGHSRDWIKAKLKPWQLSGRTEDYERLT